MKLSSQAFRDFSPAMLLGCALTLAWTTGAMAAPGLPPANEVRIETIEGKVTIFRGADPVGVETEIPNQLLRAGDRLRTGPNSRVRLRWPDQTVVPFDALTEIEIVSPDGPNGLPGLHLIKGIFSFFHRGKPGRIRIITRPAIAGVLGTEFVLALETVNNTERATIYVVDGKVEFTNEVGSIVVTNGLQASAEVGQAPASTPGFVANNILQWCFYYPAVLDLGDLPLTPGEQQALADSLAAYRQGDLLAALNNYPAARQLGSEAERIYRAALVLNVGGVDQAENILASLPQADPASRSQRLASALRQLIAAVKRQEKPPTLEPQLATEFLAASYFEQSKALRDTSLRAALALAKQATTKSPSFGFAWERVAELEFSFGRTASARTALDRSVALAPRNAQALALKGFLLAAQNRPRQAIDQFNEAIAADSGLANAWLGRGLCRIRRGDLTEGREDLLLAAAIEPQRAVLRSYLAKAYGDSGDYKRAAKEIELAKNLDPGDPTAWLYSALLDEQTSQINEGIRGLQRSLDLNENRQLYRSRLLLDQDRAVRSANLARLYADADLEDVAVREAGRGVTADYTDYSSHAFLANSYEVERRANLSTLRFEAASFSEYLLANLLGPANGRLLAQPVTQLEYSQLFDRNRLGLIANTEYFSRGAWHQSSAQYGTLNGSSYSLESEYRTEPGERANQDLEIRQLEAKFKHDLTPDDSLYLRVADFRSNGGDTTQHFDQSEVSRTFRFDEKQTPTVLAGYHHQWSPQNHTLALAGYFDDTLESADPASAALTLDRFLGTATDLVPATVRHLYHSRVKVFTTEAQQIVVLGSHSLIAGARAQWSKQSVDDVVADPTGAFFFLLGTNKPVSSQHQDLWTSTAALYGYDYVRLADAFQIVGGINFTHQSIPVNTATAPISSQRDHQERVSPKTGFIWDTSPSSAIRGSYTKSLTGAGLGQSVRLEPAHIAGMLQTFRSAAPLSLVGELDGADLQTAELVWEARKRDTYLSLGGQWLDAKRDRRLGLFLSDPNYDPGPTLGLIQERIRFNEYAMDASAHQLLGAEWSFGVRYRLAYAELQRAFPEYPGLGFGGLFDRSDSKGWLHTVSLSARYRHGSGIFGQTETIFFAQDREQNGQSLVGNTRSTDRTTLWQVNAIAGYRFPGQRAEIAVGVLNALNENYRLDPINQYAELPRGRTFYARLLLNF